MRVFGGMRALADWTPSQIFAIVSNEILSHFSHLSCASVTFGRIPDFPAALKTFFPGKDTCLCPQDLKILRVSSRIGNPAKRITGRTKDRESALESSWKP